MRLKTGDVLHCWNNRKLGKLIRLFTKGQVSHTGIAWRDRNGTLFICDSQADGTNPRRFEKWVEMYGYEFHVHRPIGYNLEEVEETIKSYWGATPYDFLALAVHFPWYLLTGRWVGRRGDDAQGRLFCSEYVANVFDYPEPHKVSPQKLFEWMEQNENFRRIL